MNYKTTSIIAELKETNTNNYQYYLQQGINCYLYELKLSSSPTIKTVTLTISNNGTIDFPNDYINYTVIGVCLNGKIWTLTQNDEMCLNRSPDCPVELDAAIALSQESTSDAISAIVPYGYYFNSAFRNGQYVGEQYSFGGGWNNKGYYRVDHEKRRFEFSRLQPGAEVILEYNATGLNCDGTMVVPFQTVAAIKNYIHWQNVEHDRSVGLGEKQRKERQYIVQFNILKHYNLMFTMDEYLDVKYRASKSTVKR